METLGCAKNRVDSEIMLGTLVANHFDFTPDPAEASVIVVNTCGFLTSAVNESIDRILSLSEFKTKGACQKLIVAGCMSERYREAMLDEFPEVDGIIGTSDYTDILTCINNLHEGKARKAFLKKKPLYSENNARADRVLSTKHHYAYLKIAEGCSNMCSFCNIPKLRGRYQSRSVRSIIQEFNHLIEKGIREVNLISQDSSSYGRDLKSDDNLYDLLKQILDQNDQEFWVRIFYSYPNHYPTKIIDLMKNDSRLVPYVDMPFQHIADPVLKKMNRRITEFEIRTMVDKLLSGLDTLALRTTFIVGFPNETQKEFRHLLKFIEQGYFSHVGVFAYSAEDNIMSNEYGDPVPEKEKYERRDQILELQQSISMKKNQSQLGQVQKILLEGTSEETDLLLQGRNQFQGVDVDGTVLINEGKARAGEFHRAEIVEAHPYDLIGRIV